MRLSLWTLLGVVPASLFVGLMLATAGVAVHPPLAFIATPLVCDGEVDVESRNYSYRPGQSGTSRTIWCERADGGPDNGKPLREDITLKAMFAAFLVYSAIAFVPLWLLAFWLARRAAGWFRSRFRRPGGGDAGISGAPSEAVDLGAILSRVSEAVRRGDARVQVRQANFDLGGDGAEGAAADPAERLAQLKALCERGLISAADYEAKKAEILAGL